MKKAVFAIAFSTLLLMFSCSKDDDNTVHTVKYNITGNSKMNVQYTGSDWKLASVSNVSSSWTYSFTTAESSKVVQLIITSADGSSVSGAISIDGQQATQNDSNSGSVSMSVQIQ